MWPSASRAWDLLNGVKILDGNHASQLLQTKSPERPKRMAEDAFGQEKTQDYPQRGVYTDRGTPAINQISFQNQNGVQDFSTRIMAHMLGLDIPDVEPPAPYYPPAFQWSTPMAPPPGSGPVGNLNLGAQTAVGVPTENDDLESWTYPVLEPARVPDSYSYDFSQFGP